MPLFNYKCNNCDNVVEKFQHNSNNDIKIVCDKCGSNEFERLLSNTQNRVWLNARDNLHQKILPDAQRIGKEIGKGSDKAFLDVCGEK